MIINDDFRVITDIALNSLQKLYESKHSDFFDNETLYFVLRI